MNQGYSELDPTQQRLIQAAGEEFARSGYRAASLRGICEAADANVSAVKYHFGSKAELYLAVWEVAVVQMIASTPIPKLEDAANPREALERFISWFMKLVLTESAEHPWAGQLMAHEIVEPNEHALSLFVTQCAGPIRAEMTRIVVALTAPMEAAILDDLINSVIALCVNPKHSKEILTRLGFPPPTTPEAIDRMAKTVARFALCGLNGFSDQEQS